MRDEEGGETEQVFDVEEVGASRGTVALKVVTLGAKQKLILVDELGKATATLNLRDVSSIHVIDEQTVRLKKIGSMLFKVTVSFRNSAFLEQFLDSLQALRPSLEKVITWKGNHHLRSHGHAVHHDADEDGETSLQGFNGDNKKGQHTKRAPLDDSDSDSESDSDSDSDDDNDNDNDGTESDDEEAHRARLREDAEAHADQRAGRPAQMRSLQEHSDTFEAEREREEAAVTHSRQKVQRTLERTLKRSTADAEWKQLLVMRYNRFGQAEPASLLLSMRRELVQVISHLTGNILSAYRLHEIVGFVQHGYNALGLSIHIETDGTALTAADLVKLQADAVEDDHLVDLQAVRAQSMSFKNKNLRTRSMKLFANSKSTGLSRKALRHHMVENIMFESHDELRLVSKSLKKFLAGKVKVEMRRTLNSAACAIDFQGGWSIFRGTFERKRGLRTIAVNPYLGRIHLYKYTESGIITPASKQKFGLRIMSPAHLTAKVASKHLTRVQVHFQGLHLPESEAPLWAATGNHASFDAFEAGIRSLEDGARDDWKYVCLDRKPKVAPPAAQTSGRAHQTHADGSARNRRASLAISTTSSDSEFDAHNVEPFHFSFDFRTVEEANRFLSVLNSLREAGERLTIDEAAVRRQQRGFTLKRNRSFKGVPSPALDVTNASFLQQHAWSAVHREWFATEANIFVGTFNVGDASPPKLRDGLSEWIPRSTDARSIKMYAIGLQEVSAKFDEWQKALAAYLGPDYGSPMVVRMWEVVLLVFVHLDELPHINSRSAGSVKTGLRLGSAVQFGNKGGVGIGFRWRDVPICFINAHLSAQQHKVSERNLNYTQIMSKLSLHGPAARVDAFPLEPTLFFEQLFFLGDLNYRVELDFKQAAKATTLKNYRLLHLHDQLQHQLEEGAAFHGFSSPLPEFAPTYRWKRGRRELSNKKEQPPSYTDRVLWHSHPGSKDDVVLQRYFSADGIMISDHRPVGAEFALSLRHEYSWPFHPLTSPAAREATAADPQNLSDGHLGASSHSSFSSAGSTLRRLAERVSKRAPKLAAARPGGLGPVVGPSSSGLSHLPNGSHTSSHTEGAAPARRQFALHLEDDGGWTSHNGDFFVSPREAIGLGAPRIRLQNVVVSLDAMDDGSQLPSWINLCVASPILHQVEWSAAAAGTELSPDLRTGKRFGQRFAYQGTGAFQDLYYAFDPQIGVPLLKPVLFDPFFLKSQHLYVQVTSPSPKDEESLSMHHIMLNSRNPEEMHALSNSLARPRHAPVNGQCCISLRHVVNAVGALVSRLGLKSWTAKKSPAVPFSDAIICGGLQIGKLMGEICLLPPTEDARRSGRGLPDYTPSPTSEEAVFGSLELPALVRQGYAQIKYRKSYTRVSTRVFVSLYLDGRAFLTSQPIRKRKSIRPTHNVLAVLDMRHVKIDDHQEFSFVLSECRPLGPDAAGLVTMIWAVDSRNDKMAWIEALEGVSSDEPFPEESDEEEEESASLLSVYSATLESAASEASLTTVTTSTTRWASKMRKEGQPSGSSRAQAPPPPPSFSMRPSYTYPDGPDDDGDQDPDHHDAPRPLLSPPPGLGPVRRDYEDEDADEEEEEDDEEDAQLTRSESVASAAAVLTLAVAAVARSGDRSSRSRLPLPPPPPPPSPSLASDDFDDDDDMNGYGEGTLSTSTSGRANRWTLTSVPPPPPSP